MVGELLLLFYFIINGHEVTLWEYKKNYSKILIKSRTNKSYLPGVKIPKEILITHDLEEASTDKNMIVLAVPSQFLRSVVKQIRPTNIKNSILVSVAKGIENKTTMTMSQMLRNEIPSL